MADYFVLVILLSKCTSLTQNMTIIYPYYFFFECYSQHKKKSKFTPSTFLIHIPDLIVHGSKEKNSYSYNLFCTVISFPYQQCRIPIFTIHGWCPTDKICPHPTFLSRWTSPLTHKCIRMVYKWHFVLTLTEDLYFQSKKVSGFKTFSGW